MLLFQSRRFSSSVSLSLIKELRQRTGAGIVDCKTALASTECDVDGAIEWLRVRGLSLAAKKGGRSAGEGLVGVYGDESKVAVAEINTKSGVFL